MKGAKPPDQTFMGKEKQNGRGRSVGSKKMGGKGLTRSGGVVAKVISRGAET